jgi:hypothetical protein
VALSGTKREGASEPGVGSTWTAVQAGGVGIIRFGMVGAMFVGAGGGAEQAKRRKVGSRKKKSLRIESSIIVYLMAC